MTSFNIQNMKAHEIQIAGGNIDNRDRRVNQVQLTSEVKPQLHDLLVDIAALVQSGAVTREVGHELRDSVLAAAEEADAPAPQSHRLTMLLNRAKEIAAGLTATIGIAEALDGVIKALSGGV